MALHPGIVLLVCICLFVLLWVVFKEVIIRVLLRAAIGIGAMYLVQILVPMYAVGINWLTIGCACVLGVPGIGMLFVMKYLL